MKQGKKATMNETMKTMAYVGAITLLVAILPLPSFYYLLLRQVVTFIALYFAFRFFTNKYNTQAVASLGVALLFNPFLPIFLDKTVWIMLDLVSAAALVFLATQQTAKISKPDEFQAFFVIFLIGSITIHSLINIVYVPCEKLTGEAKQQCEAKQDYDDYMESRDPTFP
jgi:hypothetical protein